MINWHPPTRLILIGAGAHGRRWVDAVRATESAELVGLVDTDIACAIRLRDDLAVDAEVGVDLLAVASATGAEAVIDVTPPHAHHEVTLTALAAGLPVLGEKPMAATLAEAVQLVAAAAYHDRLFMVSQSYRYNPHLVRLRDHVAALGRLGSISAELYRAVRPGGFREAMAHPFLVEMAVHLFDSARFVLEGDPVTAYCDAFRPRWSWYSGAAAAATLFEMTDGTRLICHGSWCAEGAQTPWDGRWLVSGEYGTASWDGLGTPQLDLVSSAAAFETDTAPAAAQGSLLALALQDFLHALRTGATPRSECSDNLMSLAMVHAALESAATGRRVFIGDLLGRAYGEAVAGARPEWRAELDRLASAWYGTSVAEVGP